MAITTNTNTPAIVSLTVPGNTNVNIHVDEGYFSDDDDINDGCGCGGGSSKPGGANGKYSDILQDGTLTLHIGSGGGGGRTEEGIAVNDFLKLVMHGTLSPNRPNEYNAVKAINEFMKQWDLDSLNLQQLRELTTGTFKLPGSRQDIDVPEDVMEAAQNMLENGGVLFNKIKTDVPACDDTQGDDGGGMSLHDASKFLSDFCKKHGVMLNKEQIALMAQTGEFKKPDGTPVPVSKDERAAASKMLEGNNFTAIESALTKHVDGWLGEHDHGAAETASLLDNDEGYFSGDDDSGRRGNGAGNGRGSTTITIDIGGGPGATGGAGTSTSGGMSLQDASKFLSDFCKTHGVMLNKEQIALMAQTGEFKKPDGTIINVGSEGKAAASKMLEGNNFTAIESALTKQVDGWLSGYDHAPAETASLLDNDEDEGYFSGDE